MKLYKIVFLFWIYNIFAIFQFSWMTGSWFDTEDLMQRMDYEIYKPPFWQKKIRDANRVIIIWVLHIVWVLLFVLGWIIAI